MKIILIIKEFTIIQKCICLNLPESAENALKRVFDSGGIQNIFLRHKSRIPNSPAMSDIDIVRVSLDGWLRRVNWEVNSAEQDRQYRSGLFIRPSIAVRRVRHSSSALSAPLFNCPTVALVSAAAFPAF